MNIAISKQKLTFILTGYRDVLRISLFADYEQIFNEDLQPRGKLNIISFACIVALWSDPSVTADALEKTYQSKHISELKRGFVNKLNLIKRSYFLPRNSLLVLYFKVILLSVTYALPIWGCCTNKNEFNSLKSTHCRAAKVIYNLPRDMPSGDIRKTANWGSLFDTYKVKIATLIYNIYNHITPSCLQHIIQRKEHKYDLRHQQRVSAQRFETLHEKLYFSWRIHCLEYFITIRCQRQGLRQKGKKVSRPQKLEL